MRDLGWINAAIGSGVACPGAGALTAKRHVIRGTTLEGWRLFAQADTRDSHYKMLFVD